ncbi:MAG: hypothetical protein HY900_22025 [Deltaproteobacteria bacterium]|nr:hypothetical protein [Deltaproteobacteria bacterium]
MASKSTTVADQIDECAAIVGFLADAAAEGGFGNLSGVGEKGVWGVLSDLEQRLNTAREAAIRETASRGQRLEGNSLLGASPRTPEATSEADSPATPVTGAKEPRACVVEVEEDLLIRFTAETALIQECLEKASEGGPGAAGNYVSFRAPAVEGMTMTLSNMEHTFRTILEAGK